MAKIEQVIKAELDPRNPVPEIMQVIQIMMSCNPGHEAAVLQGVAEGVTTVIERMAKKGEAANATREVDRDKPDK